MEDPRRKSNHVSQPSWQAHGWIGSIDLAHGTLLLERTATGNTIREILNEQLSVGQLRQHGESINRALCARMPAQIEKHRLEAAIDAYDEPSEKR